MQVGVNDGPFSKKNPFGSEWERCVNKPVLQLMCTGLRNILRHLRSAGAC